MSRPRRVRFVLLSTIAGLLVVAMVAGLLGVHATRRPFPQYAGELPLAGLTAPVTVHRDDYGIPQVYAANVDDLFRAQGYLHAQDRFWEMDFRRHVTAGRLSELFGESQVETDTVLRTLGWRRVAEAEWELISVDARRHLTAYADGVNAWLEATGGPAATDGKALQYAVLGLQRSGYEVEPWHPVDSLSWLKAMAWDLRGNMPAEQERAVLLAAGLSRDQVSTLYPDYPHDRHPAIVGTGAVVGEEFDPDAVPPADEATDGPPTVGLAVTGETPALTALTAAGENLARLPALLGQAGAGLGSNSWVVAGEHTADGAPLLVNDPHLTVSAPGIWYQQGLHCSCGYQVTGFSFSGLPGVVVGHNGRIGWGVTNLNPDVTDFYLERLDGDRYQVDGQWRPLETRVETIRVAGGDDVTVEVRHTHRGPVLSDASAPLRDVADRPPLTGDGTLADRARPAGEPYAISLAWTALTPGRTVEALFALNQAHDWDSFRAAAELFDVPAQNLVYADADGNIGYQAPGRVPVRGEGDGRWIAPGWESAYDWQGYIPFAELPYQFNPDSGLIVTANEAVIGPHYPHRLTDDWAYGYRGHRIHRLLDDRLTTGPLDVPAMERMLFDNYHGFAPTLVPHLLAAAPAAEGPRATALELLAEWDFQQPAGGAEGTPEAASAAAAAFYNAVWRHLLALLFDELPAGSEPNGRDRWFEVVRGLLAEPDSPWWDRVDTDSTETRDDVLAAALTAGYDELAEAQGDDPADWRWGRMHTLTLRDETFGTSGIAPVEWLFNRGPFETAGGGDLVNATGWDAAAGYEVVAAPSMRMILDFADLDRSRWVQLTGISGHAFHPHYTDQLDHWLVGETLPMRWDRPSIESAATATLTLTPR